MTCTDTGRSPTPVNEPEPKKRRTAMDEFPEAHEKGLEYGDNMAEITGDNMVATIAEVCD